MEVPSPIVVKFFLSSFKFNLVFFSVLFPISGADDLRFCKVGRTLVDNCIRNMRLPLCHGKVGEALEDEGSHLKILKIYLFRSEKRQ